MQAWQHQIEALEVARDLPGCLLNMGMGTGKSKVVVDLITEKQHRSTLILCPLSVLNVWPREFGKHAEVPVKVLVLNKGTVKEKTAAANAFIVRPDNDIRVLVVNYDSAWREPFGSWARFVQWDCVVADESQRAKNPFGKIGKWLGKMRFSAKQRLCLSGTPMPHSPLDIFAQYRFLATEIFGKTYTQFRSRYAVINQMLPSQVRQWINQDELGEKVASIAYQVGSEVLDLPEALHDTRTIDLCPKAMRIYTQLEKYLIADVESGVVTAANALVKLLRLQQLTGGHVQMDDGPLVHVDTGKADVLTDLLEDLPTTDPVVVFCRFRRDLQTVREVCDKLGRRCGELSGERRDLTSTATMPDDIDVLATQLQSGGVGIDLTRAAYAIYYSVGFSLGDFLQSLARIHRPGQTRPVRYYHLVCNNTVDQAVYGALDKRLEVVNAVLNYLRKDEPCLMTY